MSQYYKCEFPAVEIEAGTLQCSSGWLVVEQPTYQLISQEQASSLIVALLVFFTVIAVWRELGRGWR